MNKMTKLRKEQCGMSMRDVADSGLVCLRTVWQIENRKVIPRLSTLERLAKAMRCDIDDVFDALDITDGFKRMYHERRDGASYGSGAR